MKTIEERALDYARTSGINPDIDYFDFCQQDYIAGAEEQKVIDINKACEWLKENIDGGVHPCSAYGFVEKFRKAMEE